MWAAHSTVTVDEAALPQRRIVEVERQDVAGPGRRRRAARRPRRLGVGWRLISMITRPRRSTASNAARPDRPRGPPRPGPCSGTSSRPRNVAIELAHGQPERRVAAPRSAARAGAASGGGATPPNSSPRRGRSASFTGSAWRRPSRTSASRATVPGCARGDLANQLLVRCRPAAPSTSTIDVVRPQPGALGRRVRR